jgi:hypothetical protein
MLRINRIRRYYVEAAPQLGPYFARPVATDQVADVPTDVRRLRRAMTESAGAEGPTYVGCHRGGAGADRSAMTVAEGTGSNAAVSLG